MFDRFSAHPAAVSARLRDTLATIEREAKRLPGPVRGADGTMPPNLLLEAIADLITQLALGPASEDRTCPRCGRVGPAAASRCGYCWSKLKPPVARDAGHG